MATLPYNRLNDDTPAIITSQQQNPGRTKTMIGLATAQLVIGILSLILGVVSYIILMTIAAKSGTGIWHGGWIVITGIIGLCSTRNGNKANGVYMAFSIIAAIVSGIGVIVILISMMVYTLNDCRRHNERIPEREDVGGSFCREGVDHNTTLVLQIILLILLSTEFLVSIIASAYSCKICCCTQQGVVIHQMSPQMTVVTSTSTHPVGYPTMQMSPQYVGQMAPQYATQQMAPPNNIQAMQPIAPATEVFPAEPPAYKPTVE